MSTTQITLENVQARGLPYWKLYKGPATPNNKVAECDSDENPDADSDIAYQLFEQELQTRFTDPGSYTVNIYRNVKGEKGGTKYTFNILGNEQRTNQHSTRTPSMSYDQMYENAKREIEIKMSLERIEKKIDAIGDFILSKTTEDKDDDDAALKLIGNIFGQAMKQKTAGTAAVSSKGFGSL